VKAIFKRELSAYFKNPIGWIILAAYGFLSGLCVVLFVIANLSSSMNAYFGIWLYFVNVIVVSLLSFRFFAEEKKNKTDQLIFTSPVSIPGAVAGKYLSAVAIFTICTLFNIFYAFVISLFGEFHVGEFVIQMLGCLLIGCAMLSVALFISTLTESQIGTVASTFAVLIIMYAASFVASFLPGFLGNIIDWISLYSRFSDFAVGILSLAPCVYYVSVTAVFLFGSCRMLEKRRWA